MADVSIDSSISTSHARGMRSVVFTTPLIGYCFYINLSTTGLKYKKTTDGGATWGVDVLVSPAVAIIAFDVWFDQWTPGDSGTLIHIWWFEATADDVVWRSLNTSGDTLGTATNVFVGATAIAGRGTFVSGSKTRSGYLYCAYDIDAGAERGFHRSTDSGTTWSANLSTTFVEATVDQCLLFPASNTGDNNDCWAVYHDASADALTLKMWDSSAGSATESATIQAMVEDVTDLNGQYGFSASVRHSDGHLILASVLNRDVGAASHGVWDINGTGSITAKTAIAASTDDHYHPAVFIDQLTDDIYVAYNGLRDGSEVLGVTTKIYYVKSTDGGATWSSGDTAYMEGAAGICRQVHAPLMGPLFYVAWRVAATLLGNAVNSVVFTAGVLVSPAAATGRGLAGDPTVMLGSLGLAPSPSLATLAGVAPTVVLGAVSVTPANALGRLSGVNPTVVVAGGGTTVTPAPAVTTASGIAPSVVHGSLTLSPAFGVATCFALSPSVRLGSVAVSPAAATRRGEVIAPTVGLSSLSLTPANALGRFSAIAPTVIYSSVTVAPANARATFVGVDPTVLIGGGGTLVSPAPAQATYLVIAPTVLYSSTTALPGFALMRAVAVAPVVLFGSNNMTPTFAQARLSALGATILEPFFGTLPLYLPERSNVLVLAQRDAVLDLWDRDLGGGDTYELVLADRAATLVLADRTNALEE